jgi:putative cardiolipin synthase
LIEKKSMNWNPFLKWRWVLRKKTLVVFFCFVAGCSSLPKDYSKTESSFMQPIQESTLTDGLQKISQNHPGQTAMVPLFSGMDALIGRIALAVSASNSLDLQYYIWHNDNSGKLMMAAILAAADRGVRVRLLLDEIHGDDVEDPLRAMSEHQNIEVRLFNPFHNRSWKSLDFLTRFSEANRRMHNKAFIADNSAAIIGGRNIGDEYFEASKDLDFGDFDIVVFGKVVSDVSKSFDLYWNNKMAVPIEVTYGKSPKISLENLRQDLISHRKAVEATPYAEALKESPFLTSIRQRKLETFWGSAVVVADSPQKISEDNIPAEELLIHQLRQATGRAEKEIFIISPYFVPGDQGVAQIAAAVKRGVKVKILTNSLASNDVSVVHAGYKGYRKALIEAGVSLYELKPSLNGSKKNKKKRMFASRSGLHGKVYFFDNKKMFVGSMNLDPRSLYLNSEMGLVVDSPELIRFLLNNVEDRLNETTYRVYLDEDKDVRWESFNKGEKTIYTSEPETSWWQRFKNCIVTPFVPEDML